MANTEKVIVQVVVQGEGQLKSLDKQTKGNSKSFLKLAATIGAATAAFGLVNKAVSNAIKGFKDFEFQMARVRAISGANNDEFNKLKRTALELGRTTFFTANQVAELQTNFSKLGFTTREILAAQEATLGLATVTGVDLGRAAEVAGAAVRSFNLDASDTARVVDIMNLSFASSALDLEKFQTSMSKVGPIAAGMNIPLETTTAIMGTLTDAGIEASIAGTSLRNIFLQLGDPTSKLSQALGFTVKNSGDLHKALGMLNQMTPEVRRGLVNIRQVAALNVMAVGAEKVERLNDKFDDAIGTTQEMSDMMKDTLQGSIFELLSAIEGLSIALFEELVGTGLKESTQGLTEMINKLTDNASKVAQQIKIVGRFIATVLKVTLAYKAFNLVVNTGNMLFVGGAKMAKNFTKNLGKLRAGTDVAKVGFRTLGIAIKAAFIATGIGILVVAITELVTSLMGVNDEASKTVKAFDGISAAQERFNNTMRVTNRLLGKQPKSLEEVASINKEIEDQINKTVNEDMVKHKADLEKLLKKEEDLRRGMAKFLKMAREEDPTQITEGGQILSGGSDAVESFRRRRDQLMGNAQFEGKGILDQIKTLKLLIEDTEISVEDLGDQILTNIATGDQMILTEQQELLKTRVDNEKIRNLESKQDLKQRFIDELDSTREHNLKLEAEEIKHLRNMVNILKTSEAADPVAIARAESALIEALVKQRVRLNKEAEKSFQIGDKTFRLTKEMLDLEKEMAKLEKEFLTGIKDNLAYDNALDKLDIDKQILAGTITQIDAEEELRKKQIENTQAALDEIEDREFMTMESHELMMQLEQQLIDLKLKGIKDVKGARTEELDQLKGIGDQLVTLAGEDEKLQGVREAGIKISAAATIANNSEALSEQFKALSKASSLVFPANIIAVAKTLALLISIRQNMKALTSSPMAKGGMIEEFGNGGMVHGKAHAFGGEKFAVGGRVVELEGGEAVINKRSTAMFRDQLSAMNAAGGGVKFADGGLLNSTTFTQSQFNALSRNQGGSINKVVVVESDITETQNVVNVIQSNATI